MAEVDFTIGHKEYRVGAADGEERLLQRAAQLLDAEAQQILSQAGRVPEPRLLLLAGLMLADRFAAMEDRAEKAERLAARLQQNPPKVEVPVIPPELKESMAELAARAESLAERLSEQEEAANPAP
ncbi:cell division protein ZapA [Paracoccus sp. 1_MG-2023]|uniref:cell division protein ZapA n=1 Tax=unclassified Paracoccus (in: a-proteobacteria) TaxID=2688777 RepID=UPI001C08831C|nr:MULTISPECIES: cell division protein ZapA [unclassified Paracoccus (in: a-proteobacteria)]MBU2958402.1 cell division protein ZapA [Paracoccus sp. C2R09]MDO6668613.1 cell division protein ZapA [Paracoccus sp. 1_MG-2023]